MLLSYVGLLFANYGVMCLLIEYILTSLLVYCCEYFTALRYHDL